MQGQRGQYFVELWEWDQVAAQYARMIRGDTITPITADPFANAPFVGPTAKWNGSSITLPNGNTWNFLFFAPQPHIKMGAYALYVDVDIQVCLMLCMHIIENVSIAFSVNPHP